MLAYELARFLTCRACNFVVTAKMHGDDTGKEYEIIPGVSVRKRADGTESVILELVPIASPKEKADDRGDGGNGGENAGNYPEKPRRFHLF